MKTYLLSFPLAELPRLNGKNVKTFLETFKTQGNLPTVKKKKRFPTKLIENKNTYSINSSIDLVVIQRESNQEFYEGFHQYYD